MEYQGEMVSMDIVLDKELSMIVWALFLILVGDIVIYWLWKKRGSENPDITTKGIAKKLGWGILAWLAVLSVYNIDFATANYKELILPMITVGISSEVVGGAFIQQYIEEKVSCSKFKKKDKNDGQDE
jgi:hypothetical protein